MLQNGIAIILNFAFRLSQSPELLFQSWNLHWWKIDFSAVEGWMACILLRIFQAQVICLEAYLFFGFGCFQPFPKDVSRVKISKSENYCTHIPSFYRWRAKHWTEVEPAESSKMLRIYQCQILCAPKNATGKKYKFISLVFNFYLHYLPPFCWTNKNLFTNSHRVHQYILYRNRFTFSFLPQSNNVIQGATFWVRFFYPPGIYIKYFYFL